MIFSCVALTVLNVLFNKYGNNHYYSDSINLLNYVLIIIGPTPKGHEEYIFLNITLECSLFEQ